ncbi:MAG TPA: glutamate--cysteine ligase [Bdellovibrionota bacterium]|nr:glutamate--cysteine ligase [Bdellovibrionota bacterium]
MAKQPCKKSFDDLLNEFPKVMGFLNSQIPVCGIPIYHSLDLRDGGYKIAAVDVNLFPGGFNNLTLEERSIAARRFREFFSARLLSTPPWRIAIYPEAHTNNFSYLENVAALIAILKEAGAEVSLAWSGPKIAKPWTIKTPKGSELTYLPTEEAFANANFLLLNHDMSEGVPEAVKNFPGRVLPNLNLGWYKRRKSHHHTIAAGLLKKLQQEFSFFDAWCFDAKTHMIADLNFDDTESFLRLLKEAQAFEENLKREYEARVIEQPPNIFLKNDSGTYGMGVLNFRSIDELKEMHSTVKRKLRRGKGSTVVDQVILQEGIPTCFSSRDASGAQVSGEPVLYSVGGSLVSCFFRVHRKLGENGSLTNLNQPGAEFISAKDSPFAWPRDEHFVVDTKEPHIYQFIAKLHAVAAALEDCP